MTAILDEFGSPITTADPTGKENRFKTAYRRALKARYDAAQTTIENETHWSYADGLSPNASASPDVRNILRNRSRYEYGNNSYYKGMMLTRANYLVGTGPKLRVDIEDRATADMIQKRWTEWVRMSKFVEKLTTAITAEVVDGECFMLEVNNRRMPDGAPQLDYRVLEAEYVRSWYQGIIENDPYYIDGIRLDRNANPRTYDITRWHPGGSYRGLINQYWNRVSSRNVIHFFREDRPEQRRGIPWMTPALPIFAQFRRFSIATLSAAEAAANAAGVVYTDSSALTAEDIEMPDEDTFNLVRGSFPVLPAGWDMKQIESQHPTATFDMYRRAVISEIARCLNMPLNIAIANSEQHNYASGRLDHQMYRRTITVERTWLERNVLGRIFQRWLNEAVLLDGYLPATVNPYPDAFSNMPVKWYWDSMPHVDPEKEANAMVALWEAGLATDEDYWFEQTGRDPEEQYRKLEEQQTRREEIGLPVPSPQVTPAMNTEEI